MQGDRSSYPFRSPPPTAQRRSVSRHNKQQTADDIDVPEEFLSWLFQNVLESHLSACGRRTGINAFQLPVPGVEGVLAAYDWPKSDHDGCAQIASLWVRGASSVSMAYLYLSLTGPFRLQKARTVAYHHNSQRSSPQETLASKLCRPQPRTERSPTRPMHGVGHARVAVLPTTPRSLTGCTWDLLSLPPAREEPRHLAEDSVHGRRLFALAVQDVWQLLPRAGCQTVLALLCQQAHQRERGDEVPCVQQGAGWPQCRWAGLPPEQK